MSLIRKNQKLSSFLLTLIISASCNNNQCLDVGNKISRPYKFLDHTDSSFEFHSQNISFIVNNDLDASIYLFDTIRCLDKNFVKGDDFYSFSIDKSRISDSVLIVCNKFKTKFRVDTSYNIYLIYFDNRDSIFYLKGTNILAIM
jgi:hypothetical protein